MLTGVSLRWICDYGFDESAAVAMACSAAGGTDLSWWNGLVSAPASGRVPESLICSIMAYVKCCQGLLLQLYCLFAVPAAVHCTALDAIAVKTSRKLYVALTSCTYCNWSWR